MDKRIGRIKERQGREKKQGKGRNRDGERRIEGDCKRKAMTTKWRAS